MVKRLFVSGYKAHELGIFNEKNPGLAIIKKALKRELIRLLEEELEWVIISGQLGVEMWAAETVLELKKEYPHLKLAVITPFLNQEEKWKEETQDYYRTIVMQADYLNSVYQTPYEGVWQLKEKDKFLLSHSDGILLVYDEENEGSPKFLSKLAARKAEMGEYQLVRINAYDLQTIAEEQQQELYNGDF
ncbi:SLOG family protein [Brevibacillus fluminis]|uniref:SLOG family protein n=1 Tax=Brevibacillus fluminis TaxID=511487 RepID=UPI003F8ABB28